MVARALCVHYFFLMSNTNRPAETETAEAKPTTEQRVAALKETLKKGLAAIETGDDWKRHLSRLSKAGPLSPLRYSFNNQVLLFAQSEERAEKGAPVDVSAVATFDTWKRQGRLVRKGEKALWILRPSICKNKKRIAEEEAKLGRKLSEQEQKEFTFVLYGLMPVFAVSQTDGEALPDVDVPKLESGDGWARAIEAIKAVALADGIPSIEFRSRRPLDPAGALGWCKTSSDRSIVVITNGQSRAEQFSTAVHELAHAILHCGTGSKDKHEYAHNEVEAESIAYIVCGAMDLDISHFAFGYVKTWAAQGKVDAVKQVEASGRRISQTACRILDALAGVNREEPADVERLAA
jgi:hypothetical protein